MPEQPIRLLPRREVERRLHLSTATLYRLMGEGRFPRPIRVGNRAVRWLESDLNDYLKARPQAGPESPN